MKYKTISGRITEETALELHFLRNELGTSQTEILETAIHKLYVEAKAMKPKLSRYEFLKQSGFVGSVEAEPDLSSNYKNVIYDYLLKKHGRTKKHTHR